MSRALLGLTLAAALMVFTPVRVAACTCAGTSEDSALEHADVAFVGVVAAVEDPNLLSGFMYSGGDPILYTFAVEESLKGDPGGFVVIRSNRDGAACGIPMAVGERWRIYAHRQDLFGSVRAGELWVWLCDANQRLATGVPVPPVPGNLTAIVVFGIAATGLLALGVLASRRGRPPPAVTA
ncbi:MAG: hypothetical protein ACRDFZ_03290 [Candidatus Limnocylindria bacterium]